MNNPPIRILIVEDNSNDEVLLLRQLKKAQLDAHVKVVTDGGEALDFLTDAERGSESLVAVFLDLKLPTVSGLELLEGIRASERIRHLPVIIMTSSNASKDLDKCRELGASAFVAKPVTFSTFTKAVADSFHTNRVLVPITRIGLKEQPVR